MEKIPLRCQKETASKARRELRYSLMRENEWNINTAAE